MTPEEARRALELVEAARAHMWATDSCEDYDKHQDSNEVSCETCDAHLWGIPDGLTSEPDPPDNVNSVLYQLEVMLKAEVGE